MSYLRSRDNSVLSTFSCKLMNLYYRKGLSKMKKEARRMVCDCTLPSKEDIEMGCLPCGDDCLNRMLMIEWYIGLCFKIWTHWGPLLWILSILMFCTYICESKSGIALLLFNVNEHQMFIVSRRY